ncbi:receptor-like protein EIX1 [Prosopis cineraria]|uniref:receptor-like protein EIX1 n=1 Tax=Prosopis cineraria TaxID=364024 RepID=UPI00240F3246|nr:receptor-like protein EIX1 [Prosopis cineraria]
MSPSLLELKHLSHLDLSLIDFQLSPIPSFLGSVKQLRYLNLSYCFFSRRLPHYLGNLTNLQIIDLNEFYGHDFLVYELYMDDFTWVSQLSSLQYINIRGLYIENDINIIMQNITSLRFLDLSSNNLISTIPLCFIKRIQHVNLSNNKFSVLQSSHPWNSKLTCNLKSLDLFPNNKFEGETYGSIKNISVCINNDLQELDLSHNELKDLIESFGQLKDLVYLNLASNSLNGPIPLFFRNLTKLEELILKDNQFNGTIPAFLGRFSYLRVLDVSSNYLTGNIPDDLRKLFNLKILDLSTNSLEGFLGEIILGNMSYLCDLRLGMNKLFIKLAPNRLPPFQLINLNLSSCIIGTPFPQWFQSQKKFVNLDLSNTSLWGTLPAWFQQENLFVLDLSNNEINGQLPRNLHNMILNLTSMFLSNNLLNGSIPKSLCKLQSLQDLNLLKNKLSGKIPSYLGEIESIELIDLSSNELSGAISQSFCGSYWFIQSLNLSNNSLHGELPSTLRSCYWLEILDLGNNQLYGIIPSSKWEESEGNDTRIA